MAGEWYDPSKVEGTGIYDFVEAFAERMTSDGARAATDGAQYRRDSWMECLARVSDTRLRETLESIGPFGLKGGMKDAIRRLFDEWDGSVHDVPHVLIGLSMSYMGANPRLIRDRIPADWRK
jgi:hypothetical protein